MYKALVLALALWGLSPVLSPGRAQVPDAPAKRPPKVTLGIVADPAPKDADQGGVVVREVGPDSPAAKAGLKTGDVIVKVGDKDVKDFDDLVNTLAQHKPGDKLSVQVRREGKETNLTVTLGERRAGRAPEGGGAARGRATPFLGVQTQPLTPEARDRLGVAADEGVVITDVVANTPAAQAGLRRGDVITAVEGTPVKDLNGLVDQLAGRKPGDVVTLTILRDGQPRPVSVTLQAWPAERS